MTDTLTHEKAARVYDRIGRLQDTQGFYENAALDRMVAASGFSEARSVLELGCGTGALAERLLRDELPDDARYVGLDVSEKMVGLTRARIAPWSERAEVRRTDGAIRFEVPDRSVDRVVSTYVLDLLSEDDIRAAVAESARALAPEGRLCLVSLTHGQGPASRLICRAWEGLHRLRPALVGGCRPIELRDFVGPPGWRVLEHDVVCVLGICSEVLVATPSPAA